MDARAPALDELARGLRPLPEGITWFAGLDAGEQSAVPRDLRHFCVQARATRDDALAAVHRARLRATHTPSVLVARGPLDIPLRSGAPAVCGACLPASPSHSISRRTVSSGPGVRTRPPGRGHGRSAGRRAGPPRRRGCSPAPL
ncbi:DUF5958 family protein [Streptomyces puniciscabiei]|uniref:DUF5958 family protein n=1 Tax=Streptomyces puniciscabiei TaxID=164348 RepID=UPI00378B48CB